MSATETAEPETERGEAVTIMVPPVFYRMLEALAATGLYSVLISCSLCEEVPNPKCGACEGKLEYFDNGVDATAMSVLQSALVAKAESGAFGRLTGRPVNDMGGV